MLHKDRKWNHCAHSEVSVAECAQNQRRHKTNEDDMTYIKQVAMCPPRLSCCSAWPSYKTYAGFKI